MRIFFLFVLILVLCCFQPVTAQQEQITTVSGVMLSSEGEPLPGVAIRIKGTNIGTTSDFNGFYSLEAPVGSTLVVSFVGFNTYEIKVKAAVEEDQQREKRESRPLKRFPNPALAREEVGVAVLSDSSASYKVEGRHNDNGQRILGPLAKIKHKERNGENSLLLIPSYVQQRRRPRFRLEYTTALSRSVAYRLPDLQRTYAQGRSVNGKLEARGAEEQERFSWGPALSSLSRDASGNLVSGKAGLPPAQAFDPYRVFRTGISTENHLQLFSEIDDFHLRGAYGYRSGQGIIPGNNYNRHALDFSGRLLNRALEPRLYLSYNRAEEYLPQAGTSLARIISSIYTSPPNFDVLNGFSGERPWKHSSTYLNEQGEERSFAPGLENHPYWLIHHSPDLQEEEHFLSGVELKTYRLYPFDLQYNVVFEQQNATNQFGFAPGTAGALYGSLTERKHRKSTFHSNLSVAVDPELYSDSWELDMYAAYLFGFKEESFFRQNKMVFESEESFGVPYVHLPQVLQLQPFRRQHEIITKADIYYTPGVYYRLVQLGLVNRMYLSSTMPEGQAYFLPAATLKFDLSMLDFIEDSWVISRPKLFTAYSSTLQEAPLIYNQWHFNSLGLPVFQFRVYNDFFESRPRKGLKPENQQKWELGAELGLFEDLLDMKLSYYRNLTQNFILPRPETFELDNVAEVKITGLEVTLSSNGYFNEGNWQAGLTFSRSRPLVQSLYPEQERVPIAGFPIISTNLIEGEPLGVIVGNRILRDKAGRKVIGPDGFPLLNPEPAIIGNPNPDWLAGLHGGLTYKKLGFSFVIDGRKGGDMWNGTQQFLNYYGVSQITAELRNVKGYVFEGVTPEGGKNQQPVDFYDPSLPVLNNRWQRYGIAGVGEEAVEEASMIRINEVQLTYDLSNAMNSLLGQDQLEKVKVSLLARNLLLFTTYTGVDPDGNLFGYQQGSGLDLFNQPATRSLGFALNFTF
ncbi:TonB-dependent receptor [Nafulsella turpanensis]|uniref:TonB-dependent receptor n=1 Tax=Nafulsella turpanensis TaxID=1265690 RepID=UPI00034A0566|nr:carboxypeptidase-like regulatory domain-containing protein [Nafulsella turpanensis]